MIDTKGEGPIDTTNQEKTPLYSHTDQGEYCQQNAKPMFLCLQTKKMDCDLVLKLNFAQFSQPLVLHGITSMEYTVENTTGNHLID